MTLRVKLFWLLALAAFIIFSSCEKEVDEREADEMLRLDAYIKLNYPDAIKTSSGLFYVIIEEGDGTKTTSNDYILYDYTGMDLDENVFETTIKSEAILHDIFSSKINYVPIFRKYYNPMKSLLPCLFEGFSLISQGGKAKIIVPSRLAYGKNTYKGLNPFTSVIFDIELVRVVSDPDAYEKELIENYLSQNYPDLVPDSIKTEKGVYILEFVQHPDEEEDEEEEEENPVPYNQPIEEGYEVTLDYQGRLVDGFLFDTSIRSVAEAAGMLNSSKTYEPIKVTVGSEAHIQGFSEALLNLTTFSYAKVLIPSSLAYKDLGTTNIHPYAPLVFDLEIFGKKKTIF